MLKLTNELDLGTGEKIIALSNLSIYCTWKNIESSYNNSIFKISVPTWNDKFELPDGLYSVANIQDPYQIFNIHQYRYMRIRLKTGLRLKLKIDMLLNF